MGWWKVQGTDTVIADGPLDALGDAVNAVVLQYQASFNRRPKQVVQRYGAQGSRVVAVTGTDYRDTAYFERQLPR